VKTELRNWRGPFSARKREEVTKESPRLSCACSARLREGYGLISPMKR